VQVIVPAHLCRVYIIIVKPSLRILYRGMSQFDYELGEDSVRIGSSDYLPGLPIAEEQ
jgi:hypothetical protein